MATVFVSHASSDDSLADDLRRWLEANGFDDLFLDHGSIRGGDRWTEALRRASATCRVVLCLVTEHWRVSDECFEEFVAAWYQGKRIIPLLVNIPGNLRPSSGTTWLEYLPRTRAST